MKSLIKIITAIAFTSSVSLAETHAQTQTAVAAPMTVAQLQQQYPNATIKQVSVAEFENYKRLYAQNTPMEQLPGQKMAPVQVSNDTPSSEPYDPCHPESRRSHKMDSEVYPGPSQGSHMDFSGFGNGHGGNGKGFLIVVAVIGVVVVAMLAVYSVAYIIETANHGLQCRIWREFGPRYSNITDHSDSQIRHGQMTGVYYSTGYRVPFGVMGLTGELGYHELHLNLMNADIERHYYGAYFLAGPTFSIPFHKIGGDAFQIELLGGTSANSDIGLMSTLRFGLDFKLAPEFSLGLNWGAAMIKIKNFDNYLKDSDQLNYLSGAAVSYRW